MQTYGNFFDPPKPGNQIVDKWRIAREENLFYKIHKQVFCTGFVLCYQFGQGYRFTCGSKRHFPGMFFSLFDLYNVK
jgi:hypothetical protein